MTLLKDNLSYRVYNNEPIMRFFVWCGFKPTRLTLGFFMFVSIPITVWGMFFSPFPSTYQAGRCTFLSYGNNISWSISMVFLFPFIVGLTLYYYNSILALFKNMLRNTTDNDEGQQTEYYFNLIRKRFGSWIPTSAIALITVSLNIIYIMQLLDGDRFLCWMNNGVLFRFLSNSGMGLSSLGFYAIIIQIVLIYWVLNLLWKGFMFAWVLNDLFKDKGIKFRLHPLHPDGACGLSRIGTVAMTLNVTVFLIGIYISLKVIDRTIMQGESLWLDIGNPLFLTMYILIAPLLFFLPLWSAHDRMSAEKENFLNPISLKHEELILNFSSSLSHSSDLDTAKLLREIEGLRAELKVAIPVWPFNFRSIQAFFGTIVVPIVPVLLPILINLL